MLPLLYMHYGTGNLPLFISASYLFPDNALEIPPIVGKDETDTEPIM